MGFLDRLKNFGSKILKGIKRVTERVVPVVRKIAPFASKILKHVPLPGMSTASTLIDKYADPVLQKAQDIGRMIPR